MQLAAIIFQIQCIPFIFIAVLPINLHSIQTQLWLLVTLLAVLAEEKLKTLHQSLLIIASKITIFLHRNWKFMSFKREMNAESNDVDSKVF